MTIDNLGRFNFTPTTPGKFVVQAIATDADGRVGYSSTVIKVRDAKLDLENWFPGIYFLGDSLRTAVVVIHQLPVIPETLWLRLLGKGRVQQRAIEEVQALDINNPLRGKAINLLANLKTTFLFKSEFRCRR